MTPTHAELFAAAQRSAQATARHDRAGWVGLFTADGRIEDPVGSRPHVGRDQIERFYDTFIGPRQVTFRPGVDIALGRTVIRDVELEIGMGGAVRLRVPAFVRYDLEESEPGGGLAIARLRAFWDLPAMVWQFLRNGADAVPAGLTLTGSLLRNQKVSGAVGFAMGFRRVRTDQRAVAAALLTALIGGDELAVRRLLGSSPVVTLGDDDPLTADELGSRLRGAIRTKTIGAGCTVVVALHTATGGGVVFVDFESRAPRPTRLRYFPGDGRTGG